MMGCAQEMPAQSNRIGAFFAKSKHILPHQNVWMDGRCATQIGSYPKRVSVIRKVVV